MDSWRQDGVHDECGVFGVFGRGEDVARTTYFGLFALQHRGQESAGIAVADDVTVRVHKEMGLVTQVFDERRLKRFRPCHIAIGHTRYSTMGSAVVRNAQPILLTAPAGQIAVAHNGNLVNTQALRDKMTNEGTQFDTTNDSEVIARILAECWTGSIEDAIRTMMGRVSGAYSLVVLTKDRLIAVRDPHGIRPLSLGRIGPTAYAVASETCALNVTGAQFVREIEPGEMVTIDDKGVVESQVVPTARHATCIFEFIYFARPDSRIFDRTLHQARRRMGQELAREHPAPGAQIVMPIPDSAIPAALGYAEAARLPYSEGVVKNRYIQRTFIQPDQRMRELGAKLKYTPLRDVLDGRRVVMVDDSIVRGNTTGKLVRMLLEAGAKEVHVRISSPPVKYPCYYGIDMADQDELVAHKHSVEDIRRMIGATSLGYLSLEGVVRGIGMHKNSFCRACFDGKYPIDIPEHVRISKMMLEDVCEPSPEGGDPIDDLPALPA
jgi:amidophosphoribosyltransferase